MRSIVGVLVFIAAVWLASAPAAFGQDCAAGYYSATGQEPCSACNPGTYQPSTGQTSCLSCGAGTYSGGGAAVCSCCPAGYSSAIIGAATCQPCGAGTYQLATCSTSCDPCPGGQANPCNGNGTCSDGPTGDGTCSCFAGYSGAACETATPCSPGYYSATGNVPCSACPPGSFQGSPGQTTCSSCPVGQFSGAAAASCSCCPAGTASASIGASSCGPCGSGTYQLNTCSTSCDPCPGGQATPCNGNGTCSDGPTGNGTCSCFAGYTGAACENGPTTTTTTTAASTTTTTMPAGACPSQPTNGCLSAAGSGFQIKTKVYASKNQLRWKWSKGQQVAQTALGDPSATTNYFLCVYDTTAGVATLATTIEVDANPAWVDKDPKGWTLKDKSGSQDGVQQLQVKTGADGKSKAQLKAKGAAIPLPTPIGGGDFFDQDPTVTVQLRNTQGTCWTSSFTVSDTKKNEEDSFKATDK